MVDSIDFKEIKRIKEEKFRENFKNQLEINFENEEFDTKPTVKLIEQKSKEINNSSISCSFSTDTSSSSSFVSSDTLIANDLDEQYFQRNLIADKVSSSPSYINERPFHHTEQFTNSSSPFSNICSSNQITSYKNSQLTNTSYHSSQYDDEQFQIFNNSNVYPIYNQVNPNNDTINYNNSIYDSHYRSTYSPIRTCNSSNNYYQYYDLQPNTHHDTYHGQMYNENNCYTNSNQNYYTSSMLQNNDDNYCLNDNLDYNRYIYQENEPRYYPQANNYHQYENQNHIFGYNSICDLESSNITDLTDESDTEDSSNSGDKDSDYKMNSLKRIANNKKAIKVNAIRKNSRCYNKNMNKSFVSGLGMQQDQNGNLNAAAKRKRKRILNRLQRAEATMREKRRMLKLNKAFEELRKVLPISEFAKNKLSRAETLKSAIEYIEKMSELLSI